MKTSAMITMATMLAGSAWAGARFESQKVVICLEDGNYAGVADATANASNLFLSAGVNLEWHAGLRFCQRQRDQAIMIRLMTSTPKTFHPGSLAYALPYEGVHIQVFYDRIARADPDLAPSLLAYVFVHEVTHILQGIDRHSKSGIMKALWTPHDCTLMKGALLRFTELDVEMIHDSLAARAARSGAGALVSTVAP
jgi:hypothetical protein